MSIIVISNAESIEEKWNIATTMVQTLILQ
jgi:hypothetical protein